MLNSLKQFRFRNLILLITDLLFVILSYYLSVWLRVEFSKMEHYTSLFKQLPLIILIYLIVFKSLKIDKTIMGMTGVYEAVRISIACVLGSGISFVGLQLLDFPRLPYTAYLIQLIVVILILEIERFSYRYNEIIVRSKFSPVKGKRTLIVGAGQAGLILLKEIKLNKMYTNQVIGFIDDDANKKGKSISGVRVLGNTEHIANIVKEHNIDIIFVALPSIGLQDQRNIVQKCYETNCKVEVMKSTKDRMSSDGVKVSLHELNIEDLLGRASIQLDNTGIKAFIENKIVLVTGAAGSIGSELCRQIIENNPKLLLLVDINENGLYDVQQSFNMSVKSHDIKVDSHYIPLVLNIREKTALERLFKEYHPQLVFHAAAHKHVPLMEDMPIEAVKNNILGSNNLIELSKQYKVERFIFISTDKAVNPTNVMGATKRFVEKLIQATEDTCKTTFMGVRFGNVLGSNGSIIPLFQKQIAKGGPVTLTDKRVIRYFMTIPEAVSLVLQAALYASGKEIFVLDMGQPVKILELAENMIKLAGYRPYIDINIEEIGLRKGEKLYEELHLNQEEVSNTPNNLIFINKSTQENADELKANLKELETLVNDVNCSDETIINALQKMIVTYKPNRENHV